MTLTFTANLVRSFNVPQHPGKRLVVGVAIIASMISIVILTHQKRSHLIVQWAETEDRCPLMYELPGGDAKPRMKLDTVVWETKFRGNWAEA